MSDDKQKEEIPSILFEPFAEGESNQDDLLEEGRADIQANIVLCFLYDDDGPLKLAEMLIAHYRKHGGGEFCMKGQLQITFDIDSLPPTALDYNKLPGWLLSIVDRYEKPGEEISRLNRIIEAAESTESDSHFDDEQNKHRTATRATQDEVFGPRALLQERLKVAREALQHYAQSTDNLRASAALAFIEEETPR